MSQNVLLVAVNSRFNHTNIAVRSICRYVNAALSKEFAVQAEGAGKAETAFEAYAAG